MAKLTKHCLHIAVVIVASSILSCGGGSTVGSAGSASLRVVVTNPSAGPVNVAVGGTTVANNLPYLGTTGYLPVKAGSEEVVVPNQTFPVDAMLNLAPNSKSTFLYDGWGHFEASWTILTDDNTSAPNAAKLRIMNASPGGSIKDFYLLSAGSAPSGSPLASLGFNNSTGYQVLAPGAYEVFVTFFQTPSQIFFDSGPITLAAGQNRTIVVLGNCQPTTCNFDNLISFTLADLN